MFPGVPVIIKLPLYVTSRGKWSSNFSYSPLDTMAAWRIAQAVKGKCHRAGIAGFVKPTVHQAVTTNYTNRYKNISKSSCDLVASTRSMESCSDNLLSFSSDRLVWHQTLLFDN